MLLLLGTSLTTSAASNVYTVKSGDTLYKISQQTKVSVTNLKSYNGLKSNLIFPKQQLKLKKQQLKLSLNHQLHLQAKIKW